MNHPDLDYDQVLSTQEDIFMGSQGTWVPPLNFQAQIEHGKPFWESMRKKINFEPLVKETPFEKERKLKTCTKETQMLPTKEITIVETESPPIRRVVFHDDRVAGRSLTGLNTSTSRIDQNRLVTSVREVSQEKDAKQKPPLKGILKSRNASKYWRQCSSQSSSQHSRIITTQLSGSPKDLNFSYREKERKLSTFSKFHDFHSRYIESENDEQSEDESFKRSNSQYSEENLDPLIEFYKSNGWGTSKNTQVQRKFKY